MIGDTFFSPHVSAIVDVAFCQNVGGMAVAEQGAGLNVPTPLPPACAPLGGRVPCRPVGLSSQELNFHLRILNMNSALKNKNKKPIEYLQWLP